MTQREIDYYVKNGIVPMSYAWKTWKSNKSLQKYKFTEYYKSL